MASTSKRVLFRSPERRRTPAVNFQEKTCFDFFCFTEDTEENTTRNDTSRHTSSSESSGGSKRRRSLKGRALKICVVESAYTDLMIATRVLQAFDFPDVGGSGKHEIVQAATGSKCMDLMRKRSFDIVFIDINLPDISGFEAAKSQREYERLATALVPQILVGMIDVDDCSHYHDDALEAGMDLCMKKPFTVGKYNQVLDALEGVQD